MENNVFNKLMENTEIEIISVLKKSSFDLSADQILFLINNSYFDVIDEFAKEINFGVRYDKYLIINRLVDKEISQKKLISIISKINNKEKVFKNTDYWGVTGINKLLEVSYFDVIDEFAKEIDFEVQYNKYLIINRLVDKEISQKKLISIISKINNKEKVFKNTDYWGAAGINKLLEVSYFDVIDEFAKEINFEVQYNKYLIINRLVDKEISQDKLISIISKINNKEKVFKNTDYWGAAGINKLLEVSYFDVIDEFAKEINFGVRYDKYLIINRLVDKEISQKKLISIISKINNKEKVFKNTDYWGATGINRLLEVSYFDVIDEFAKEIDFGFQYNKYLIINRLIDKEISQDKLTSIMGKVKNIKELKHLKDFWGKSYIDKLGKELNIDLSLTNYNLTEKEWIELLNNKDVLLFNQNKLDFFFTFSDNDNVLIKLIKNKDELIIKNFFEQNVILQEKYSFSKDSTRDYLKILNDEFNNKTILEYLIENKCSYLLNEYKGTIDFTEYNSKGGIFLVDLLNFDKALLFDLLEKNQNFIYKRLGNGKSFYEEILNEDINNIVKISNYIYEFDLLSNGQTVKDFVNSNLKNMSQIFWKSVDDNLPLKITKSIK